MNTFLVLIAITAFALLLNLPFGYLRSGTRKFSLLWMLYIHIPIPFIFILRKMGGLDFTFVPVIAVGAVAGQFLGGRFKPPGAVG
ncbi:MAG TPA: hypothetical protein ENJ37_08785 [Deltaproteobacteria bacterium]|nr:hypothetical protein [Deltaproteobacteria bacterium]